MNEEQEELEEVIEPNFSFIEILGYFVIAGGLFATFALSKQLPNLSTTMIITSIGSSFVSGGILIALGKIASELKLIRETIIDQIQE